MEKELISIVLTLYNKAPYIEETIFSIYKQTYTNRELIIVDDCSTDWSLEIAKSFCEKIWITNKCKFIKNENNLRVAKTFERWLKEAKWEWISMCDWDDILMKNKLEENLRFCKKNHVDFCSSDLVWIDENNNIIFNSWIRKNKLKRKYTKYNRFIDLLQHWYCTWSSIFFSKDIKNQVLKTNFPEDVYQDRFISVFASFLWFKIWFAEKILVYYRRCDNCITRDLWDKTNSQIVENRKKVLKEQISMYEKLKVFENDVPVRRKLINEKIYIFNCELLKYLNWMKYSNNLLIKTAFTNSTTFYEYIICLIRYKLKNVFK